MKISLDFDPEGVCKRFLRQLDPKSLRKISRKALKDAAEKAADIVRQEYKQAEDLRTKSTLETYAQGKSGGVTPGRSTYMSATSMNRTGQLAGSVIVKRVHSAEPAFTITINSGQHTKGDPADRLKALMMIANQLEQPSPVIISITPPMMGYLQVLLRGEAGQPPTSGRAAPDVPNQVILVIPQSRGVWAKASERLSEANAVFSRSWKRYFKEMK